MNTFEKAELTTSIRHIAIFLKSGIPIYNSEVPDTASRKTRRRRRAQAIAKRYTFHANTQDIYFYIYIYFGNKPFQVQYWSFFFH